MAGVAAGGAIVNTTWKEKGLTLPGSEYVGPGNPINIDAPKHTADVIAKEHDVGYQTLIDKHRKEPITHKQFREEVRKLDQKAYEQFSEDFKQSGSWHSYFGDKGLRIKSAFEDRFGQIYPPYTGKWEKYPKGLKMCLPTSVQIGRLLTKDRDDMRWNNGISLLFDVVNVSILLL